MADYSHEVIQSLQRFQYLVKNHNLPENEKGIYSDLEQKVKQAVKFDFGTKQKFFDLSQEVKEVQFFKLPWEICTFSFSWLDAEENEGEERTWFVLAFENEDQGVTYAPFMYSPMYELWSDLEHRLIINPTGNYEVYSTKKSQKGTIAQFYKEQEQLGEPGYSWAIDFLIILSQVVELFSCSNVTQVVHKAPKFINQKRKKKGKVLFSEYRTIAIPTQESETVVGTLTEQQANRLGMKRYHPCRGHIRRYKSGKKTWVTGHWRGNPEVGTIHHDYKVE